MQAVPLRCMSTLQVAEVVAQVLLQAQTDVLVEVAADPGSPLQPVDSAVAQVYASDDAPLLASKQWLGQPVTILSFSLY